ncbi:MAG TPA: ester cyclase [Reyranella sp.]|nr:ester cyclase [Reyranella sp.]
MNDVMFDRQTLSAVWQEHTYAEFVLKDADAALATMVDDPYVLCVPSGLAAIGRAEVRNFYARRFLPWIPPDFELTPLSQVSGGERMVEEFVARFTHSLAMDWMLPGVPATGRKVEIALVVIIGFRDGKISHEHIYWDQATVLSQLGLIDLPVCRGGVASAARLLQLSQGFGVC